MRKYQVQPIHYPELLANMKAAMINEALQKNVSNSDKWPSRRSSDTLYGWFQTTQAVQAMCIAHAVATDQADKDKLLRAMILESDYGLGRNPMNMVQMTGLGSRHVDDIYTTGRNDGTPGVHPGHTPYMNSEPWGQGFMADPKWYANKGYPTWDKWPQGEALWPAPYCYANNEFTPQQTMRERRRCSDTCTRWAKHAHRQASSPVATALTSVPFHASEAAFRDAVRGHPDCSPDLVGARISHRRGRTYCPLRSGRVLVGSIRAARHEDVDWATSSVANPRLPWVAVFLWIRSERQGL